MLFERVAEPCVPAPCALVPWNPVPTPCTDIDCHFCWGKKNTERQIIRKLLLLTVYELGEPDLLFSLLFSPLLLHFSHISSKGLGGSRLDHQASRSLNGHTAFGRALWSGLRDTTRPLTRCTGRLGSGSDNDIDELLLTDRSDEHAGGNTVIIVLVLLLPFRRNGITTAYIVNVCVPAATWAFINITGTFLQGDPRCLFWSIT